MQNFIDTATQQAWAFEDDVVVVKSGNTYLFETAAGVSLCVPSTLRPYTPPTLTAAQVTAQQTSIAWEAYRASAQAALTESDKTILRCYENAVPVPGAWSTYRKALRAIVSASSGDPTQALPSKPSYPSGT
ncbi:tail fiber assembly protein [Burkholderia cepacia]|uniref:hypothetical protein n=1 Tax=Burkholderia cepacia TaxID=292 RepID=UPI0029902601|nr:hypothetical protein [Burkholderia cepacia]